MRYYINSMQTHFAFDLFFAINTDISEQDMAHKSLL
jgi:hypothetical protein